MACQKWDGRSGKSEISLCASMLGGGGEAALKVTGKILETFLLNEAEVLWRTDDFFIFCYFLHSKHPSIVGINSVLGCGWFDEDLPIPVREDVVVHTVLVQETDVSTTTSGQHSGRN